jgi:hypothetical protein
VAMTMSNAMSEAWAHAEAALPPGWEVRALVRGPRLVSQAQDMHDWLAWARPTADSTNESRLPIAGRGDTPDDALEDLARRLREL